MSKLRHSWLRTSHFYVEFLVTLTWLYAKFDQIRQLKTFNWQITFNIRYTKTKRQGNTREIIAINVVWLPESTDVYNLISDVYQSNLSQDYSRDLRIYARIQLANVWPSRRYHCTPRLSLGRLNCYKGTQKCDCICYHSHSGMLQLFNPCLTENTDQYIQHN